ncbi:MAG: phospholipase D-like domain-containing protein [Betaproteobacteria bacterium]
MTDWRSAAAILAAFVALSAPIAPPAVASTELTGAGTVELAFTPGDAIDARIVAAIDAAEREVLVLAFAFTQPKLARALAAAHARGVTVEIVADRGQALELPQSAVPALGRDGIAVWLDGNFGNAHNKVIVVDAMLPRAVTITGSYNFTVAAQTRNAENVAIFRNNSEVARAYRTYFKRLQAKAVRWDGGDAPPGRVRVPRR